MATATGGDMVLQLLRELRDLEQQVRAEYGRMDERVTRLHRHVEALASDVLGLRQDLHSTRVLHEKYFTQLGRTVNLLAENQLQDRERLDDLGRRIIVLEQA